MPRPLSPASRSTTLRAALWGWTLVWVASLALTSTPRQASAQYSAGFAPGPHFEPPANTGFTDSPLLVAQLPRPTSPDQAIPAAPGRPAFNNDDDRALLQRLEPTVIPRAELIAPPSIDRAPPLDNRRTFDDPPVIDEAVRFPRLRFLGAQILNDHRNYYSWRTAGIYTLSFGAGAVLANTSMDQNFQNWWQNDIGDSAFIHSFKYFGEGMIVIPSYAVAAVIGEYLNERPAGNWLGQWGQRSLRTVLVGGPPMLLMQFVTGGSRPGEKPYNSAWHPFQDNNGVSGHSFMGAIPFLTAAQMTDRPVLKATLYAGSTLTGFSRVNDNAHYLSQVMLGWWMAYAAVIAVDETERDTLVRVVPISYPGTNGLALEWRR